MVGCQFEVTTVDKHTFEINGAGARIFHSILETVIQGSGYGVYASSVQVALVVNSHVSRGIQGITNLCAGTPYNSTLPAPPV